MFASQRAFDYAPLSTAISLSMDRSSLLRKEPSITLRYLRLSRSLWIAHLCFAKSLRLRSAIYGYLALYGSLIFASQRAFDYAPLSTAISLSMDRSIDFGTGCKIKTRKNTILKTYFANPIICGTRIELV
ncbi:hypothetical protein QMM44_17605 [Leptospira santarosai]|nr:hypothetical protein [Leptospira santarosai]MDI7205223.1 hypothetical protein [Leptospira santarosai]